MPVDAVQVLCTCALVLCVTAVLLLRRTRAVPEAPYVSKGPRKVVLLGVEEAGKTNVFLRMVMGVAPDTTTSQRVNAARLSPSGALPHGIELVDTPGHARLRAQLNELWAQLSIVRAKREAAQAQGRVNGGTEWVVVDESSFDEITQILGLLQQGLVHLSNTLMSDSKALDTVCEGLKGVPLVGVRHT